MSTSTTVTSGGSSSQSGRTTARGPQWRRAAAWMLAAHLYLAVWFWLIALVVVTIAIVVVDRVGTIEMSIMQFASQGATWFPFATAIIFATAQIGVHVANGMTRRSFLRAALLTSVVAALVYALVMSLTMLAEGAVYDSLGWPHVPQGNDHAPWENGFGPALMDYWSAFLAAQVSGLLVGITYYRFGGWWGTLLLPLTVAPVLLALLGAEAAADGRSYAAFLTSPLALVAWRLVLIALAAYAFYRLTRDVPIRQAAG